MIVEGPLASEKTAGLIASSLPHVFGEHLLLFLII